MSEIYGSKYLSGEMAYFKDPTTNIIWHNDKIVQQLKVENEQLKAENEKLRFPREDIDFAVLTKEEFENYRRKQ